MLEQILERSNLLRAWKRVRSNGGAGGVDGVGIDDFPQWLRQHWPRIKTSILEGSYRPGPVRRHEIPKRSGGTRSLGIPTLIDRVIQQAILQILQPIVDPDFSGSSYGFRPGRSAHQAVRRVRMCYVKQWRRPRTRIGNLRRLGVSKRQAIAIGMSSKGPWRLSRTYASQVGMSNQWLSEQGLVSVRELWIGFHHKG